MHVRKIELRNFIKHKQTTVTLPSRGVVLVTGPNGSGKSSLIEAVSVAFWGKTLRGTPPWKRDTDGHVCVAFDQANDEYCCTRTVTDKGHVKLKWTHNDKEDTSATPSKAQEALESHINDWDTWRRTCVFRSQDAALFTMATDSMRKKLIEDMCDMNCDDALKACRADMRELTRKIEGLNKKKAVLTERVDSSAEALVQLGQILQVDAPEEPDSSFGTLDQRSKKLAKMCRTCQDELGTLREQKSQLDKKLTKATLQAQMAKQRADRLDIDTCPTCEQPIQPKLKKALQQAVQDSQLKMEQAVQDHDDKLADNKEETEELSEELEGLRKQEQKVAKEVGVIAQAAHDYQRTMQAREEAEKLLVKTREKITETREGLKALCTELEECGTELRVLSAVEKVLGLEGVRAHVISRTLRAIEAVSNGWLSRLAGDNVSLSLKPYSKLKKGGTRDQISLDVHGVGEGYGYPAASQGEQRRLDAALLFALASLASTVKSMPDSTYWLDEITDSLDPEGVEAIVGVIQELSNDRCVVVISHIDDLSESLKPDLHLKLHDGRVTAVGRSMQKAS
jgi:exonuclease SbcC